MPQIRTVTAALVFIMLASATAVIAAEMGIITDGEKGTYYQFGLNLRELAKQNGVALNVHTSQGSIENVPAVYERKGVQLGIVQSDVLAFVARVQSDEALKRIAKKTKMVSPLHNEEVHILAREAQTAVVNPVSTAIRRILGD